MGSNLSHNAPHISKNYKACHKNDVPFLGLVSHRLAFLVSYSWFSLHFLPVVPVVLLVPVVSLVHILSSTGGSWFTMPADEDY